MQDGRKVVWSIPYVSVAFFPSLKQNFIAYRSSKGSVCIFEIHQLWQLGFSRVYSNSCCSGSLEPGIIKIGQSSHKMYSNCMQNFQESTTILNAHTKKSGNLSYAPRMFPAWCFRQRTCLAQGRVNRVFNETRTYFVFVIWMVFTTLSFFITITECWSFFFECVSLSLFYP